MKHFKRRLLAAFVLMCAAVSANALVMDFGSGAGDTITPTTSYSQNGLTMTPLNSGSVLGSNHWDWFRNSSGATAADWHAGIHTGNNGEEVEFTFGGASFDLISISIEAIILDGGASTSETGTFTSSSAVVKTTSTPGLVDFSGLSGFQNITSFTFSMPFGVGNCAFADCVTMMFDDVQFQQAAVVPLPAAACLFMSALGMLGWARKKAV